jgi:hypothetical protein
MPSSTYRDVVDILRGTYDRVQEPTFKTATKRESIDSLLSLIKKQKEAKVDH